MCQKRNSRLIPLWFEDINLNKKIRVDSCMANLIMELRSGGIDTLSCCCGHKKYDMSIVIKDYDGDILDLISGIKIPRKKRFYKKDKQGYYYIPETIGRV